jgi:hypothetical protein
VLVAEGQQNTRESLCYTIFAKIRALQVSSADKKMFFSKRFGLFTPERAADPLSVVFTPPHDIPGYSG